MAYIGNQNYQAYVTLNNQTFTTSGSTTIYALNYTVTNANNLDLYIGGSKQQPGVAYTASGNTLTLTTATSSSMYAVYLGQGIQTVQPGNSSITTSMFAGGLGGVEERKDLASQMSTSLNPKQLANVIDQYQGLMAAQGTGLKQKWTANGLPAKEWDEKLVPAARDVMMKHEKKEQNQRSKW